MMNGFLRLAVCVVAAIILCSSVANATILVTHQYNLGESDGPGAAIGNVGVDPTVDSVDSLNLARIGQPIYATGAAAASSTLAMNFTNTWSNQGQAGQVYAAVGTGHLVPTNYNWGVDFWVKVNSFPSGNTNDQTMVTIGGGGNAYDNNPNWGLKIQTITQGTAHRFNITDFAGWGVSITNYEVPLNTWMHLVYVDKTPTVFGPGSEGMNFGDAHFFIDGVDAAATYGVTVGSHCMPFMWMRSTGTTTAMPNKITIGAMLYSAFDDGSGGGSSDSSVVPAALQPEGYYRALNGVVDSLRVFTFAEGQFNINDTTIPEPGTLALLAAGLIGLLCYAWRKRK